MPATTLDDGGWGSIIGNFGNALVPDPSNRAKMMLMGAQYQKQLLDTEEQRRKMDAVRQSVYGFPSTVPPELTLPKIDGQEPAGPVLPADQQRWKTTREQMIRDNAAASNLARSADDFNKVFTTRALGEIAGGIPKDPARQDVLQTYLQTGGTSLPNYTSTPQTYQSLDPATNQPTGPAVTSRRLPEGPAALASPVKVGPVNNFENKGVQQQRLFQLSEKARTNPDSMTIPELEEAKVHLQEIHPMKNTVQEGAYGKRTIVPIRENPFPDTYAPLLNKVAHLEAWKNWVAGGRSGPPPEPPDRAVGGLVGGAPTPAPAVAGAPAAAVAAPAAAGARPAGSVYAGDVGNPVVAMPPQAHLARAEWTNRPEVKHFIDANADWESMRTNMTVNSPQADIAIIYAFAKIMDPGSVVREGEYVTIKNNQPLQDQLNGYLSKAFAGQSALTKNTRAGLADAAFKKMDAMHGQYDRIAGITETRMNAEGFKPGDVVDRFEKPSPVDIDRISSIRPRMPGQGVVRGSWATGGGGATTAPPPGGGATTPPPPGAGGGARPRTIRVNPDGSIVDVP